MADHPRCNAKSRAKTPAKRANEEYVVVRNIGTTPVLLDGYYLRRKASTYPFMANTRSSRPGGHGAHRQGDPTATTQFWGQPSTLLNDYKDGVAAAVEQERRAQRRALD